MDTTVTSKQMLMQSQPVFQKTSLRKFRRHRSVLLIEAHEVSFSKTGYENLQHFQAVVMRDPDADLYFE